MKDQNLLEINRFRGSNRKPIPINLNYDTDDIHITLTKKDLDRIFVWYNKGWTDIDKDKPLFEKLQKVYQGE